VPRLTGPFPRNRPLPDFSLPFLSLLESGALDELSPFRLVFVSLATPFLFLVILRISSESADHVWRSLSFQTTLFPTNGTHAAAVFTFVSNVFISVCPFFRICRFNACCEMSVLLCVCLAAGSYLANAIVLP